VTGISNKKDSREVCTASAEYDHRFNDMWDVKGQYYLYYAKQNDLGFYDVMSNTFGLQPSVTLDNGLLTFPCAYNHTLVNDKAYLSSPTASTVLNYMMNDRNMAQTYIKYQNLDYLWSVTAPEDDRDGFDFGGGVGWYYFYSDNKGFINVKYGIDKQETDGSNWDYLGHRTTATLLLPVMDRLNLTFTGDIFFQGFLNTHATYNVVRRDQVYTLSALAAVKVYKETELQFQYTYTNDDSNINIYKYSRNIFSAGIEMKF
jgi:hypothetical protein